MSNNAYRARTGQDRSTLYDEITDKIIAELEAGHVALEHRCCKGLVARLSVVRACEGLALRA